MSSVQSPVVAIFTSDIHFSEKEPIARSSEKDWMLVQKRWVDEIRDLQTANHMAPLYVAGDLLHSWKCSPYLLSCLINWFDGMAIYAIPGNHDLPNHNYKQLSHSAYWTLTEAKAIYHLIPGGTHTMGSVTVHPFPYSFPVTPPNRTDPSLCLQVALIHDYIWVEGKGHYDASVSHRYGKWASKLKGYDLAFFGDNHIPFTVKGTDKCCPVVNCGVPLRRHSDEQDIRPSVVMLRESGKISRCYLSGDKNSVWLDLSQEIQNLESSLELDLSQFAADLSELHSERVDFAKTVLKWCEGKDVPDRVKQIILRCLPYSRLG